MTRNHRRWHAWVWLVLGPLIAVGFVVGLLARPTPPVSPPSQGGDTGGVAEPAPLAAPGGAPKATTKTQPWEATP